MDMSLTSLEGGLRKPFELQEVKFLPKSPVKNASGGWVCLALPYSDKRAYEDRLNELAFGHWSTPPSVPIVAGNKLVIPVTVVLCGVAHTDYGEAFLTSHSRAGDVREEENSATEGYSQAFRRACAQFRLGRYYYDLPKVWVPYNTQKRVIALNDAKKQELAERLYREAGLLPSIHALPGQGSSIDAVETSTVEAMTEQQQASIEKLCQKLNRPVPPITSSQAARALLHQLAEELNNAQRKDASTSAASIQEPGAGREAPSPTGDEVKERLNALYPRAKALGCCSDAPTFLTYAATVLKIRGLSAKTITMTQLDLIETDLVARELQSARAPSR
ncbi:MAG: hypothetical protein NVS2B12_31130 [Ktedonobacteraceae bacterium]